MAFSEPDRSVGALLRTFRRAAGLSQEELAGRAGLSVDAIGAIERGVRRRPHPHTLRALASALNLSVADRASLFGEPGAEPVQTPSDLRPALPQVRFSLPPDAAAFTGRSMELDAITDTVAGSGGVVSVHAIGGMPGVGKTALAVRAAHQLRERFPDRQLFVDLHGHTPGKAPMPPLDALAGLLAAVGVDARFLPGDLAGRAGLWRDRMAGQRAVLVLDNAVGSAQVVPLLPGGECLVLVTSRRHLGDLPGPVVTIPIDALPPAQAEAMFIRLAPRAASAPAGAVTQTLRLAGGLPLAISLLARVYARHRSWTLADLVAETETGLLTLTAENESVAAAFEVSYRYLPAERQRFFRCLGIHPGTVADAYAAAALAGVTVAEAAGMLDGLHGEGLLTEAAYRRYGMHDLIRHYAQDLAAAEPTAHRERARERLLDYYQHTATTAESLLTRRPQASWAGQAASPGAGLPGREQALAWEITERGNLLACLDDVTRSGQHARVVALTAGIASLLRLNGPWTDAATRHRIAAQAACDIGDRPGHADALTELGCAMRLTSDHRAATEALEAALGIYRDLGDRVGEGNAFTELAIVWQLSGDYPAAVGAAEAALAIFRDLGERLGEGNALTELGVVRWLTGDYPGAAGALEAALGIYRGLGDRLGEGNALTELANVWQLTGDYRGAAGALEAALAIFRDLGNRLGEANATINLAVVRRRSGDYPGAAGAAEAALAIFRDLGERLGESNALTELATVRRLTGDYTGAAAALDEALGICRDRGDQGVEVEVLNETATLHRVRGDVDQAAACLRRTLILARQIGSSHEEARALAGLGRCALAAGDQASAVASLRHAHEIFSRLGDAEADEVAAELRALA